jgi:hypothetical protein
MRPKGSWWFGEARACAKILKPISTEGLTESDAQSLADRAREAISSELPDLRSRYENVRTVRGYEHVRLKRLNASGRRPFGQRRPRSAARSTLAAQNTAGIDGVPVGLVNGAGGAPGAGWF